jgi:hypothetical protein
MLLMFRIRAEAKRAGDTSYVERHDLTSADKALADGPMTFEIELVRPRERPEG